MTAKHVWARPQDIYQLDVTDVTLSRENTRTALHDASVLPRMKVRLMGVDMTVGGVGGVAITTWDFASHAKVAQPNSGRYIQVVRFAGGNHFVSAMMSAALKYTLINVRYATDQPHVNIPEETMRILADNNVY